MAAITAGTSAAINAPDGSEDFPLNVSVKGDNDSELWIAVVALVISIIAFVVAILQALQQYYSSARGYSSCGPAVIGKWAKFRHRVFLWNEFRFEVQFEVPVMFVARPTNKSGPVAHQDQVPITVLDGKPSSYEAACIETRATLDKQFKEKRQNADRVRVHTADNEAATWLDLLVAIQRMEEDSRNWQKKAVLGHEEGCGGEGSLQHWPPRGENEHEGRTLSVCMQRKKKSWDTIPDNVTKPYATTTIAHLVEFSAMLGIYWLVFDREEDRYLAQGNGFILSGSNVEGLGLTFTITKKGPTWFESNRLVPQYAVKELCFGLCPTIFRLKDEKLYADESKGIGTLQLGSMDEIAENLTVLGCNVHTVNYFRNEQARYSHLFPIPFELLGMTAVVFQVKRTLFRTLPNPTMFKWDPKSFDLFALLTEFGKALESNKCANGQSHGFNIDMLLKDVKAAFVEWDEQKRIALEAEAAEKARKEEEDRKKELENMENKGATQGASTGRDLEGQNGDARSRRWTLPKTFSARSTATTKTTASKKEEEKDKPLPPYSSYTPAIFDALHNAIESCDAFLEPRKNRTPDDSLLRLVLRFHIQAVLDMVNRKADATDKIEGQSIHDLDGTSDRKHAVLMEIYFGKCVRRRVIDRVLRRQGDTAKAGLDKSVNDIWCTLMFRMLCWLLLHHFHEKDVQVKKSDVYESRMPVYIV
ncbi:hypothetical protein OQA88_7203 [Cercophora sp. LCS_1]